MACDERENILMKIGVNMDKSDRSGCKKQCKMNKWSFSVQDTLHAWVPYGYSQPKAYQRQGKSVPLMAQAQSWP